MTAGRWAQYGATPTVQFVSSAVPPEQRALDRIADVLEDYLELTMAAMEEGLPEGPVFRVIAEIRERRSL